MTHVFVGCPPGSSLVAHVVAASAAADRARGLIYYPVVRPDQGYPQIGWVRQADGSVAPAPLPEGKNDQPL